MDIPCPRCAEPWDNDSIHEEVSDRRDYGGDNDATYHTVLAEFRSKGCEALTAYGAQCNPATLNSFRAQVTSAMFDICGDDADGVASLMDDFDYAGLLD